MKKITTKITTILYLSLATFPLMKANINSIFIILCSLFTIYDFIKNKKKVVFSRKILILTAVFWMFLVHEIISFDFSSQRILLYLPFLVLPLLFLYRPSYIDAKIRAKSLLVFQGSVLLQSLIYLFVFLKEYSFNQLFSINNYNIPLFRTFVFENTYTEIHSTYFSAFLLCSFTISLFFGLKNRVKKWQLFHFINIVFTLFFTFVFISKITILTLLLTLLFYLFYSFKKRKNVVKVFIGFVILGSLFLFSFKDLISERFNEIKTEINRPLKGNYHNSINIRVAIIKCSLDLLNEVPLLGFGNDLQKQLNSCYEDGYDSNFYKLATYNTHNYYFNLVLYGGWLFLILFFFYIFLVFKRMNFPFFLKIILTQILIINFTENFLSRHHGIILFIYFISLFLISKTNKEIVK